MAVCLNAINDKQQQYDMMPEAGTAGTIEIIYCYATASKHVSTANKTCSNINNTQATATQQPT
jgi:hypothetical protein